MNYNRFNRIISNYQSSKIILGLERIKNAAEDVNNPQNFYDSIHIAGTKGKGSVAYMLESILTETGLKVGLYTSPHILEFTERYRINKQQISKKRIVKLFENNKNIIEKYNLTYFEAATLLAFKYFYEEKVDIAIFETGLGGRFDATNILNPILTIITQIDFDHTEFLGNNLSQIAMEKAGIIKRSVPNIFFSETNEVTEMIEKISREKQVDSLNTFDYFDDIRNVFNNMKGINFKYKKEKYFVPLIGVHQINNVLITLKAIERIVSQKLKIDVSDVRIGLKNLILPGRIELICKNPIFIVDCAHNAVSFEALTNTIKRYFPLKKICLIFGIMKDKDFEKIVRILKPVTEIVYILSLKDKRALRPDILKMEFSKRGINAKIYKNTGNAVKKALINDKIIVAAGSFQVVEKVKKNFIRSS